MQMEKKKKMPFDLTMLETCCCSCRSTSDLYSSSCKHMPLCFSCGKIMAQNHDKCSICYLPITRLIQEYNFRISSSSDKNYHIGKFVRGLPDFFWKKWSIHREGLQERQITDTLTEEYGNKPWLLEDERGQYQYQGHLVGSQSANYYLLIKQGKELVAIPACYWYNFNKVSKYRPLTLEEAEEKITNRRKCVEGYQRRWMKVANNGAAAFGEVEEIERCDGGVEGGHHRKGNGDDDEDTVLSYRGDIEKGVDWEYEDIFTDDDEAVDNDQLERDDLAPKIPAPPGIEQDEHDDEDDGKEVEGKLTPSGKELEKLLGRVGGDNNTDEDTDEDYDDDRDDMNDGASFVMVPKQKFVPKEEPVESIYSKAVPAGMIVKILRSVQSVSQVLQNTLNLKEKDSYPCNESYLKSQPSIDKEEPPTASSTIPHKGLASTSRIGLISSAAPFTEDEIKAALLQMGPITSRDLVDKFNARLKSSEDKSAFACILKRIAKRQKISGLNYIVLRDESSHGRNKRKSCLARDVSKGARSFQKLRLH
ncbi:transcription initiation factor IIF, alpha subunit [Cinnamomum micranthum f. kanehirae]|uniref:Transcription initiation factor IIF subunit alpha n=1 Tax=Cinnamomum micranthum f. kanehirae TaxID=337451 RepID=A0A443NU30_9MAGN|nr:transcription initiation factor IIF, alpha subunit [Cinnamomum micranthum f. kanehirae]